MAEQEVDDILIPIRRWIRGHYTKLTSSNKAKCNHCAEITIYNYRSLANLHEHLVKRHPDILSEEEKKEDKFDWVWDYFIAKSNRKATCKICDSSITYQRVFQLKCHLKRIHKIFHPNSDCVEDNNDSNTDNDTIANEDITKKTDYIPARLYIRKHYTKLPKRNDARCNYCNAKFAILNKRLAILHDHLVKRHPDILSEEEKKDDKFHWSWDYFIEISDTEATCKLCDSSIKYHKQVTPLKNHLKLIHKIFNPNSDRVEGNNESNSDNDMIANEDIIKKTDFIPARLYIRKHYTKLPTSNAARCNYCNVKFAILNKRLAILHDHLVKRHPDILSEEEKKDDKFHWSWDYFIAISDTEATCKLCDSSIKYHKEVTALKNHLKLIHKIFNPNSDRVEGNNESNSDNDMIANEDIIKKTDFIPARLDIRKHYTKLPTSNAARCNYCNVKFAILNKRLAILHDHLVKRHPDILSEEEKKDDKFDWSWDYFIAISDTEATCKLCDSSIKYHKQVTALKNHLKLIHKIVNPNSDRVESNSESNSDNEMIANEDITKKTDNFIPVHHWIRKHYTKLPRNNSTRCNYCNAIFTMQNKSLANLHEHLMKTHLDKLSEEEKKEDKFHWTWNYFIAESDTKATCTKCDITITIYSVTDLKMHLKRVHKILGPNSNRVDNESNPDNDMSANKDI